MRSDELREQIKKKAKTIHGHIHKNAEIWNKGDYKASEKYGEQKVILLSDVSALLEDYACISKKELREPKVSDKIMQWLANNVVLYKPS